jgi:gpW
LFHAREYGLMRISYPIHGTIIDSVPTATLQQWLLQAQNAMQALMIGQRTVSASYGDKSVTYTPADTAALTQWIHLLQRRLNVVPPRRAIRPYYR